MTTVQFSQPLPSVVMAKVTSYPEASVSFIHCLIPGGKPQVSFNDPTLGGTGTFGVSNAPTIYNMADFRTFIEARFGSEVSE